MSDLESKFMIGGKVVEFETELPPQYEVYMYTPKGDEYRILYFVDKQTNDVVKTFRVDADCVQDQGYIDGTLWS